MPVLPQLQHAAGHGADTFATSSVGPRVSFTQLTQWPVSSTHTQLTFTWLQSEVPRLGKGFDQTSIDSLRQIARSGQTVLAQGRDDGVQSSSCLQKL